MNRVWGAAALIIIIAVICTVSQISVDKNINDTIEMLNEVNGLITNKDYDKGYKKAQELETKWLELEWKLAKYLPHNMLEEAGTNIAMLPPLIKHRDLTMYDSQSAYCAVLLIHLKEINTITVRNLF